MQGAVHAARRFIRRGQSRPFGARRLDLPVGFLQRIGALNERGGGQPREQDHVHDAAHASGRQRAGAHRRVGESNRLCNSHEVETAAGVGPGDRPGQTSRFGRIQDEEPDDGADHGARRRDGVGQEGRTALGEDLLQVGLEEDQRHGHDHEIGVHEREGRRRERHDAEVGQRETSRQTKDGGRDVPRPYVVLFEVHGRGHDHE